MTYPFIQAYNDYGLRRGPVQAFVVHMAEGGGTVGYLSRSQPRGVSVHYVIEYSGRIVQMLLESHASGSINPNDLRTTEGPAPYGATVRRDVMGAWDADPNAAVISLEMEGFATDGPNDSQVAALRALVSDVRSRYPSMGLLGHRDFQDYKACPGPHIPWAALGGHGQGSEADMAISTRGLVLTSDHAVTLPVGTVIFAQSADGAEVLGHEGGQVDYFGTPADGWKAVRVDLGQGSLIGYTRTAATVYAKAPAPPADCADAIAADRLLARITYDPL